MHGNKLETQILSCYTICQLNTEYVCDSMEQEGQAGLNSATQLLKSAASSLFWFCFLKSCFLLGQGLFTLSWSTSTSWNTLGSGPQIYFLQLALAENQTAWPLSWNTITRVVCVLSSSLQSLGKSSRDLSRLQYASLSSRYELLDSLWALFGKTKILILKYINIKPFGHAFQLHFELQLFFSLLEK